MSALDGRRVSDDLFKDYLDTAVGAVSDRLAITEEAIRDRLEQSDRAGAEQHARIEQRMTGVEAGLTKMGERVGALERQQSSDAGVQQGKKSVLDPTLKSFILPLLVIICFAITAAGVTAVFTSNTISKNVAQSPPSAASCVAARQALRSQFKSGDISRDEYQSSGDTLVESGCPPR